MPDLKGGDRSMTRRKKERHCPKCGVDLGRPDPTAYRSNIRDALCERCSKIRRKEINAAYYQRNKTLRGKIKGD